MFVRWPLTSLLCLLGCPLEAERTDDKPEDTADTACTIQTFWFDDDADGYGDPARTIDVCELPFGYADNANDCDDSAAASNPAAAEVCDGIDNDCEGTTDESAIDAAIWYQDLDDDGFGNAEISVAACTAPTDYIATNGDCDDLDSADTTGTTWFIDDDADGWGSESVVACAQPVGTVLLDGDCDDADPGTYPDAPETCNGLDDDCDTEIDEEATDYLVWYADHDGDGYGTEGETAWACEQPAGFADLSTDCDDTTSVISPDAAETCSGVDDDCDGLIDGDDPDITGLEIWYIDTDADGHGVASTTLSACAQPAGYAFAADDCDDANANTFPGADETCDGTDEDCDTEIDESAIDAMVWYADADADGYGDPATMLSDCELPANYVENSNDCDGLLATTSPEGVETCDGFDEDCDGEIDEQLWYADTDGDGYGDPNSTDTTCVMPSGFVPDWSDCDDTNGMISPTGVEVCGGTDEDCDGLTEDADDSVTGQSTWYIDLDGDGFGAPTPWVQACEQPSGYAAGADDCDDADLDVNPNQAEVCEDGLDNDCEGTDEACSSVVTLQGIDFVSISAGSFEMGCTAGQSNCETDETLHTVTLTRDYSVSGPSVDCSGSLDPYDCEGYRLLTEAEWEGAARCGEDLLYAGSVTISDVGWYSGNSSASTHAVGEKAPNACGLFDMSGNVFEWTQDWYGTVSASAATDPAGAATGSHRIGRGGSWYDAETLARISIRNNVHFPTTKYSSIGFRVAKSNR